MPPLEIRHELESQEHDDHHEEHADRAVEPRRVAAQRRRVHDPAVRGAGEVEDAAGEPAERRGELLEFEKAYPGELAGAPGAFFSGGDGGGGGVNVEGGEGRRSGGVGMVELGVVEGIDVVGLLTLLVPPFLELVVGSARHGKRVEELELDE